jgi:flagellar basal body-associated protein FliL
MKKDHSFGPVRYFLFFVLLGLLAACTQREHASFDVNSQLLGGGRVSMTVNVDFKDKQGVAELQKKMETIRYALYLVFSRKSADELSSLGKQKTENSIHQILLKHLEQRALAVRVQDFTIKPRS